MDWDGGDRVFAVPQGLNVGMGNEEDELTPARVSEYTREFIRNFRIGTLHVYRDRLVNSAQEGRFHLEIDLEHLKNFSEELHDALTRFPGNYLESVSPGPSTGMHFFFFPFPLTSIPPSLCFVHFLVDGSGCSRLSDKVQVFAGQA